MTTSIRVRSPRALLTATLAMACVVLPLLTAGCGKRGGEAVTPAGGGAESSTPAFTVLAGSEVRDLEPAMVQAAAAAGVHLKMSYAGTLDIVERVNSGERFDAILPASGAYPSLALTTPPVAREKLFYSRVTLGVKAAKLKALGWNRQRPTWKQIAQAAGDGRLSYAMTNPASSNSGMSALFAVASAIAGKTEDLQASEVDAKVLTAFLAGQKLTAGSSGWLAEAYAKSPGALDAMVNYESVILRLNATLPEADRLVPVYPNDGVISSDHPLMLLNANRRKDYDLLVATFRAPAFQKDTAARAYLRPSLPGTPLAAGVSEEPVAELAFPNRLEVIDAVLGAYLATWRRPGTSIFVLDVSGSMEGRRLDAMRAALKVLAGGEGAGSASQRYAAFQSRERVQLITFSDTVKAPQLVEFDPKTVADARMQVLRFADDLHAGGGTAIFSAVQQAEALAREEQRRDPSRYVSVVLLTDGENNDGIALADLRQQLAGAGPSARVFPILFGEASPDDMNALAQLTGGRVFDGRKANLAAVFKEIRGYQ